MASSRVVASLETSAATRCSRPANHGASSISYDARPRHGHVPGSAAASRILRLTQRHDALAHLGPGIAQAGAGLARHAHRGGEALGRSFPGEPGRCVVDPAGPGGPGLEHLGGDRVDVAGSDT